MSFSLNLVCHRKFRIAPPESFYSASLSNATLQVCCWRSLEERTCEVSSRPLPIGGTGSPPLRRFFLPGERTCDLDNGSEELRRSLCCLPDAHVIIVEQVTRAVLWGVRLLRTNFWRSTIFVRVLGHGGWNHGGGGSHGGGGNQSGGGSHGGGSHGGGGSR